MITRRGFLFGVAGSGAVAALADPFGLLAVESKGEEGEAEVTPVEDLMREHGVLRRVLLIYVEWVRRLGLNEDEDVATLAESNRIVRAFVQDYHEKLEEEYVFPGIASVSEDLSDLADVLAQQHGVGRTLIDVASSLSDTKALVNDTDRSRLSAALADFIRMYRPHAAREDTVAFPAFHRAVHGRKYHELGDLFEKRETKMFGQQGFESMVKRVAAIEKTLGIYDLAQFTSKA